MADPEEKNETSKEETQIDKQKKALENKKRAIIYLKSRVEELERAMALNYAKGHFTLASHDAKRLAATMDVLGDIDQTQ